MKLISTSLISHVNVLPDVDIAAVMKDLTKDLEEVKKVSFYDIFNLCYHFLHCKDRSVAWQTKHWLVISTVSETGSVSIRLNNSCLYP